MKKSLKIIIGHGIISDMRNMVRSLLIFSVVLSLFSAVFPRRTYSAEAPLRVDTESACVTSECHGGMGKKKYVHGVGVSGKHCVKCHKVLQEGEHRFELPAKAVDMCIQCHSGQYIAPSDIEGSPPVVISSSDVFEEGKGSMLHKPFEEGKCTECHSPHESDYANHLKASYPDGFYTIFDMENYGLCLNCHKDFGKALEEPRTLTATKFRNGNLNLHFRHVNKTKGRTCKACHHPHGSENPKLIKESFIFGKKRLSIDFERSETGGSCGTSCHSPVKYDRYDPVEILMKTTPRIGREATQEELTESRERDLQAEERKDSTGTGKGPDGQEAAKVEEKDARNE